MNIKLQSNEVLENGNYFTTGTINGMFFELTWLFSLNKNTWLIPAIPGAMEPIDCSVQSMHSGIEYLNGYLQLASLHPETLTAFIRSQKNV